jgi:small subunit ribosomal protein S16
VARCVLLVDRGPGSRGRWPRAIVSKRASHLALTPCDENGKLVRLPSLRACRKRHLITCGELAQASETARHAAKRGVVREENSMVKIRLMRMGMKGAPTYRIVVADARSPRDGRIIENIGSYNPRTEPSTIVVDQERAKHWLSVGAQPTESVTSLLRRAGVLPRTETSAAAPKA